MLRVLPWLLGIALTVYAAVDCIQTDESRVRNLPKLVWVFLILLFAVRRADRLVHRGPPPAAAPHPRPRSPAARPAWPRR